MIDTLKLSKRLQASSMPQEQADAFAEGLGEAVRENLVTNERLDATLSKLEIRLVCWIIGTNAAVGGVLIGVIVHFYGQMTLMLQHWKP